MLTPTFKANNDFPNSIEDISEEVIIYPNPFTDILYLKEEEDIEVRDLLGKIIYTSASTNRIQTSDWDSGVYFVNLQKRNRTIKIIKILKTIKI